MIKSVGGNLTRAGSALLQAAAALLVALNSSVASAEAVGGPSVAALGVGNTKLGVYDPAGTFAPSPQISIEHVYLPLYGVDLDSLERAGAYVELRGRNLLITVEPWLWGSAWDLSREEYAAAIASGETDDEIVALCKTVARLPGPVMLRWGHEMDSKTERYAWSLLEPHEYIAGYRHFVSLCRQYVPSAQFVWSPLGLADLGSYYPGDDVVDVVGFTVFALQPYERDRHGWDRNINEIVEERVRLLTPYEKPILIAELGCWGEETYREVCLRQFLALDSEFPQLMGAVYFNDEEPWPWPDGYGKPDWRLPPGAFGTVN